MKYNFKFGDLFTNGDIILFYIFKIEYDKYRKMNYYYFRHLSNNSESYLAECELNNELKRRKFKYYPVKE